METLITDRLTIRPVEPRDAEQVHAGMASDFEVVRHTGTWPWPADRDETTRRCVSGFDGKTGWAVALRGDVVVGTVGIGPEGEFGYMLPQEHWGQGYATEMGAALLDHVARTGAWETVKACVFEGNDASARVLEKLGFVEGTACSGRCEARNGEFPIRTFTLTLDVPVLKTDRLILRPIETCDLDAIVEGVGDYKVSKWLEPVPHPYTMADAEAFFADVRAHKLGMIWAIVKDGEFAGLVGAGPTLGYWLNPAFWGKGIMTEAVAAAIDAYFQATDAESLPSSYFLDNEGSSRVLRANGFEELCKGMTRSRARGCEVTNMRMMLTRKRWSALRAKTD